MGHDVLIVGGGIAGLATALSLHAEGIDVAVRESVPEVQPLGVGINLLPHAVRELCLLYTSPSPRDKRQSRMPSSA